MFAQFGIPETIVSDNGTCFVSAEFEAFLASNGIKHITSAPYHPSSNGLAECAVQIVKKGLRKITQGTIRSRIAKILFSYRLTPQSTTGISPSEILLGRQPRSRLDLLKPHTAEKVEKNQLNQKKHHDSRSVDRSLEAGDPVFVRNHQGRIKWLPGVIQQKTGPVSFEVKLTDGRIRRCHQDQVRKRTVDVAPKSDSTPEVVIPPLVIPVPPVGPGESSVSNDATNDQGSTESSEPADPHVEKDTAVDTTPATTMTTPPRSYPRRNRTSY